IEGFESIDAAFLGLTLAVLIAAEAADYLGRAWGARRFGASSAGALGAVLGSRAGLFFLPLGLFVGPFLGAVSADLLSGRSASASIRSAGAGSSEPWVRWR